jgi:phosphopantothenoylcysteine decarboxylase/phosphopantothenate--cysteine ligase
MSDDTPPPFGARRLLVVGTGSVSATFLPFWLNWLRLSYPALETQVVLTRSAERFVTPAAVAAFSARPVLADAWPDEPSHGARHVELAEWADTVAVYPATLHYLARLALGLADTPSLLALQCSQAPIVLAPALPPGGWGSPAVTAHVRVLQGRPNVVIAAPEPGPSITTGRADGWTPAPFPAAVRLLEHRRRTLLPGQSAGDQPGR